MSVLTDKELRAALLKHLRNRPITPRAILEELRVHNGNAVADVVAVNRLAHCYEIKGETDNLDRVMRQAGYYDQAFRRITLVTARKHLRKALLLIPDYWGVMVADNGDAEVKLSYCRRAGASPAFNKRAALLTLWRDELLKISRADVPSRSKLSRSGLSMAISEQESDLCVNEKIAELLVSRYCTNGWSLAM
jgi:hypothetical protein